MEIIQQLKQSIDGLECAIGVEEFARRKSEIVEMVDRLGSKCGAAQGSERLHERLSRREREVMDMLLEGRRLKEIAARLDISVKTVTTHRARLLKKLRLEDNLGLYRYAVRNGIIGV